MPNAAPPTARHAPGRHASEHWAAPNLPASWVGAAERLAAAQRRSPVEALALRAVAVDPKPRTSNAHLGLIWPGTAPSAPARADLTLRRLDSKGRLSLPIAAERTVQVAARRDGCVLTVYLPGCAEAPERSHAISPLTLDATGRLTLTKAVRHQLGMQDGADVAFTIDAERHMLTATAASRLDEAIAAAFAALRGGPPARQDSGSTPAACRHLRVTTAAGDASGRPA